ncbi:unnamed protein product (macronuclear) [Paramecium tetraurelia]|uniref:Uncharacterized protein n=1 Tax=Paramecium tetraurelia TaxID=5888 RepID=A0C8V0_PARTE|nr:uncharacterized protein GSPATT00036352001 [Paramecium tetraurelia]CAK67217.1 unnamed protein product [Paramecium tetraurelia]|eukprot:XP_001434614.1 hypothetical protein (macronuclear) [Paramecium tetraurelia strain d4-2]
MENQFELEYANSKSEVILDKCLTMMRPEGLEQFHFRIEEQFYKVKVEQNKVVLIEEKEGDDLQTMIAYWIQEHQQRNNKERSNYSIFCGARELESLLCHLLHFNQIKSNSNEQIGRFQYPIKVELESEKLKQYFEYWLNLCSRELSNQLYSDCKITYKRGHYIHSRHRQVLQWWRSSNNACSRIIALLIAFSQNFYTILINPLEEYAQLILEVLQKAESIIQQLIKQQIEFQTEIDFFTILVNQFCTDDPIASSIFCVLSYVNKGISIDEMLASCSCTQEQFIKVYDFFKVTLTNIIKQICFLEKNQVYSIYILTMRQAIQQIQFNKNLYEQFLQIIEHSPNSTRKLEELIQQYAKNKKFFKLKEIIINIEHFLILWNPYNKFELCQLWDMLEQNGCDLVMEYNKAVENFQAIYKPSTEGLFFIMLQICIFLREFSNFEKDGTPAYKHPLLRGQSIEFEEVGLYGELSQLKMLSKKKPKQQLNEDYFSTLISTVQLENLNLDIKNNRDCFINYYQSQFHPNILQEYLQTKQDFLREKLLNTFKEMVMGSIPMALTQKNNFSKLMQFYGKDSTQYMSIQEEMQINQKAIRLVINAKSFKNKSIQKLPEIRHRYYSPMINKVEPARRINQSLEKVLTEHLQSEEEFCLRTKRKCLNHQNQQLKNKLQELKTVKQNLYPQEATIEAYRLNDLTKTQGDELKKQMDNLQGVQDEMKRMQRFQNYVNSIKIRMKRECNNYSDIVRIWIG